MENLIQAYQKDDQLLRDILESNSLDDGFRLWWLGQSGYLIQYKDQHLLIDPYLSDSLTKKYAQTNKPHIRMSELVVNPEKLDMIDVVTSSHNHTDHLDGETLIPLLKANPSLKMLIPEANRAFVANRINKDVDYPLGLDAEETLSLGHFHFTAIPAAHEALEKDEKGRHKFLGYVIEFGKWSIYHSGDTLLYAGLAEALKKYNIDIALLPINGKDPKRKVAGNLNGKEAAKLGKDIGAGLVIPCHYDMFTFNTANPNRLAEEAQKISQAYIILRIGQKYSHPSFV